VAKVGLIGAGGVLLVIAVVGYVTPLDDVTTEGMAIKVTIPNAVKICDSPMGQLGQTYRTDVSESCSMYTLMVMGIYGSGLLGIILIIVGAVVPTKSNKEKDSSSLDILKDRYAKGEITQEKFDEMRKNLEK